MVSVLKKNFEDSLDACFRSIEFGYILFRISICVFIFANIVDDMIQRKHIIGFVQTLISLQC